MLSDDESRKLADQLLLIWDDQFLDKDSINGDAVKLAHKVKELLDRQRWIPMEEKMPPTGIELDVFVNGFGQGVDIYNGFGSWSNFEPEEVTHWRLQLP